MPNLGDYLYYSLVYGYLQTKITNFQGSFINAVGAWASAIALTLITLWILIQGFRIMTGQSRDSMMALVVNAARIAVIVAAATAMSICAVPLQTLFSAQGDGSLGSAIGRLVAGGYSPVTQIDRNMAATQLTLAAIDAVQVPPGDTENAEAKAHASLLAGFGAASPPMAAGAMLLLYQFTIALFIGLGPLFILCLIFDQTKDLFRRWLMYGIGTLFSIATLCLVTSIMLKLVENVAIALWSADLINNFMGQGTEGFSSRALEQGGIGLLMTVLIVSVPPLTANFFQGTMGNFLFQSAFGMGGARAAAMQQGLPPGAYGGGGGGQPASNTAQINPSQQSGTGGFRNNPSSGTYQPGMLNAGQADVIKPSAPTPSTGST